MGKSGIAALAALALLTACSTMPPPPPPVVAVVKAPAPQFPPRPLGLLYTTFQDHAVIQRDKTIPVWGLASPSAEVTVTFAGASAHATADAAGNWRAELPAMKAGGPYEMTAATNTGQSQAVKDLMVGDVYLCSGQSNMELPLRLATNYDGEVRGATNTMLRLFHVQRFTSPLPRTTFGADASWSVTSPETAKEFSAVCYYFGRELQPTAGVALGLIEDAWGGAAIQAWISNDKLAALGGYDDVLDIVKSYLASPKDGDRKYRALVHRWFAANDPAMKEGWYEPAYDDTGWDELTAIGGWRPWPKLAKYNGIVWLRKTVELTAAEAEGTATLTLGQVSDVDLTFVNGTEVGAGEGYDVVRAYAVPAGTLHEGKNVIAVGVKMGGAFLDRADKMNLKLANGTSKPLAGPWKFKTSVATGLPVIAHQPWLNQFGVSTLYNGMIAPLGGTQIRGIVWYQGETDTGQPKEYARLLPALIADWRGKFGADTPFFNTQLPGFGDIATKPQRSDWAELREVQRRVAEDVPDTGLAVTIDLGVHDNIHPAAKQEVGRRLAQLAKTRVYGLKIEDSGPTPVAAARQGKRVTVAFAHVDSGLTGYAWDQAIGFELCSGEDCAYVPGKIEKDRVVLDAAAKPKATAVRYCWADYPMCNLYNSEALPAGPFEVPISQLSRTPRHRDFRKNDKAK